MADFRQEAPEVQAPTLDINAARRYEASPGIASAVLGAVPNALQTLSGYADRSFEGEIALSLTDPSITGIGGTDPELEDIDRQAAKIKSRADQRSPHRDSRTLAVAEARRLAEKYPHRAMEVFEKFGILSGQAYLAAVRDIEAAQQAPIEAYREQVDNWSTGIGLGLNMPFEERARLFSMAEEMMVKTHFAELEVQQQAAVGVLNNREAQRLMRQMRPGLYQEMQGLLMDVVNRVDPTQVSDQQRMEIMEEIHANIDARIDHIVDMYDGHLSRTEAEEILAPILRMRDTLQQYLDNEISLERLQNQNNFIRLSTEREWMDVPGFNDLQVMMDLYSKAPDALISRATRLGKGNEVFREIDRISEAVMEARSPRANPIGDRLEQGAPRAEINELTGAAMEYVVGVANNEEAEPEVRAEAILQVLESYSNQFSEDPFSVDSKTYGLYLMGIADEGVFNVLFQHGNISERLNNNLQRGMERYTRDMLQDAIQNMEEARHVGVDPLVRGFQAATLPMLGGLLSFTSFGHLYEDTLTFDYLDDGTVRAAPIDNSDRRHVQAANKFNSSYSDKLGLLAKAQAHFFGSQDYKESAKSLVETGVVSFPDLREMTDNATVASLVSMGWSEEEARQAVLDRRERNR